MIPYSETDKKKSSLAHEYSIVHAHFNICKLLRNRFANIYNL